jgi:hypothetical protein
MCFADPVSVLVPGVFPLVMAGGAVVVAPFEQSGVDIIFIGVNHAPHRDRLLDQRPDRHLLDVLQHADQNLASPREHPEDRWLLLGQCPPPTLSLQATLLDELPPLRMLLVLDNQPVTRRCSSSTSCLSKE